MTSGNYRRNLMKCKRCGNDKAELVIFCDVKSKLCPKCQKEFKEEMTNYIRSILCG